MTGNQVMRRLKPKLKLLRLMKGNFAQVSFQVAGVSCKLSRFGEEVTMTACCSPYKTLREFVQHVVRYQV